MAKKKVVKPKSKMTRRQLSHWQRQKRRRRIIITLGIAVIAAVVALVFCGLYFQWYLPEQKPLKETVVEVNGTKFNMQYYIDALNNRLGEYYYLAEYYLDYTLEAIEQYELISQGAEELGFTVSDKEINEALAKSGLLDNKAARDAIRSSLLLEKMQEEYFDPQVPINAEHRHVMAMFLESEAQVAKARYRLEAGESFTEVAGDLSLESTTKVAGSDLGWLPEGVLDELIKTTVLESYIFESQVGGLSQPVYDEEMTKSVGYWLIEVLEKDEEAGEVNVRAILLSSQEEAQRVLSKMEAGEDFNELAEEYSQYGTEGSKAAIGWIAEGDMTAAFEEYVFDGETELNVVSGIIRDEETTTTGGYWLFEVLGSEIMDISDKDRETLVDDIINEWLLSIWEDPDNTIVEYLDDEMRDFAVKKVAGK